ncbi:SDR family oxidoreductase [Natronomonas sp. LN261]|jgi:NADP-dependent 3-hydroxy acid dehydrogenase YdfG|uniref:SDR family oxidoreductase n=1 Tax=Natronomonas sp. LN261 TaxID=2750669 RepID=UPI0015EF7BE5|nr:SDR family oxidoreductase [Natronomonas sp. LN261]
MSETLEDETVIVTGASSGIGAATAEALAAAGANLALGARSEGRIAALADRLDTDALAVETDVREEDAATALIEETVERFGGIDVLVNNAGVGRGSAVEDLSTDKYRQMMETNADGMFFTSRAALPHLRESGGTAIFLGSFAGQYPRSFNPVYAATKWWTRGFAKSLSAQAGEDVAVTVINPSEVRTEFGAEDGESFNERFEPGSVTEPEEIAEAIVFAATRSPSMVSELDLFRQDKLTDF